jgi:Type II secretion system (T2SS), protein E, N-terminal domain
VTVELARRLIESGVPLADIEAALLLVVERGLSLPEALAERDVGLVSRLEQELARSELPSVLTVRASPELSARLPVGMCRRLLAVPVHVDPRTGRVDVAAVEPLDPHIGQEFTYHLDQPVRVLQASLDAVKAALDRLQLGAKVSVLPPRHLSEPAMSSDAPIPLIKLDTGVRSDAPIPLVRRSMLPVRTPSGRPPARSAPPPRALPETEGVAASWRSKPPPVDLVNGAAQLEQAASLPSVPPVASRRSTTTRERLEEATSPEAVLDVLRDCLAPSASIVFAVKNASFDGRVASPAVEQRASAKQISLLSHQPSVLETAVKSGFYLGPIPNTPNHRELRDALPPDSVNEVYVTVITVSERPSLVWLLAGFEQSLDLTRRADEVALAAGRVLARILRERKRGS